MTAYNLLTEKENKIDTVEKYEKDFLKIFEVISSNGLHYTISSHMVNNESTQLTMKYNGKTLFDHSIENGKTFDAQYFKENHIKHHWLFKMPVEDLNQFLEEIDYTISTVYSAFGHHYLYIYNILHKMEFTSTKNINKLTPWDYTYSIEKNTKITELIRLQTLPRFTIDGWKRYSIFKEYNIIGENYKLIGVFNGYFQEVFALRYYPRTRELKVNSFKKEQYSLQNQSLEDMEEILKQELIDYLEKEGKEDVVAFLNTNDCRNIFDLNEFLTIMEINLI